MADNKKSTKQTAKTTEEKKQEMTSEEIAVAKKRKAKRDKKRKRRKVRRIITTYLLVIFLIVITIGGYVAYEKFGKQLLQYQKDAQEIVGNSNEKTFRQDETSIVYDAKGKVIREVKGEKQVYYKTYDEIPAYFVEAMVSVEDRRFYEHNGVDYEGIMRAAYILFKNNGAITQGASTITQQLARGIFLTNEVSYERKFKEIFIAWEMEKKYTKQQILEYYLNTIFFANSYYGIGAAAEGYFDKDLDQLSVSEVAFLCAIPNSPSYYDPRRNYDHTIERRDKILNDMHELGYINELELQMALEEEIKLAPVEKVSHDYVETYTNFCATEALMEQAGFEFKYKFDTYEEQQKYNKAYRELYDEYYAKLYTGGYRIYTSIEQDKQKLLQKTVDETLVMDEEKNEETGIYNLQGAATCIDNSTGRVVAIVGGRTQEEIEGYSLNRAYQSARQPGSTIKPIIVYTPQLERGYTPATRVDDCKPEGPGADRMPKNSGSYSDMTSLAAAVAASKNIVAYRLYGQLTPQVGIEYLLNMNFNYLTFEDRENMAACLGGLTYGATTVEMASGYATIENDGEFRKPTCIVEITDSEGNVIVSDKIKSRQVYEMNAARMMTSMLKGVFTGGTASGLGIRGMSCAGKTGTTDNNTDGWFCGFTPYYTTSVWVGYDTPQSTRGLWGSTYPGSIWSKFNSQIHEGLTDIGFPDYEWVRSTKDWKDTRSSSEDSEDEKKKKKKKKEKKTEKKTESGKRTEATTQAPTTQAPTEAPTTQAPTEAPTTQAPTEAPTTQAPTEAPPTP
ncbi:MAG: transglycosylase domain-containing protein [Lachnospiraceae bacterium]|nr:transglycosylase domain-containing protein [Lachnospiraceae bacterium]